MSGKKGLETNNRQKQKQIKKGEQGKQTIKHKEDGSKIVILSILTKTQPIVNREVQHDCDGIKIIRGERMQFKACDGRNIARQEWT